MGERGCGYRSPGGVYLRVIVSPNGKKPVESCLVDPPVPVSPALGVPNRGVLILERNDGSGIFDVYDRVGSKHYVNVADFVEETKREGVSRRVKRDTRNLDKLTLKSRIFLIHERAIIAHAHSYYKAMADERVDMENPPHWHCRTCILSHTGMIDMVEMGMMGVDAPMCVSLYWDDIQGGSMLHDPNYPTRTVEREIGSNSYRGRKRPEGVKPEYQEGVFFNFPLHCLDIIRDPEGGQDAKALESVKNVGLPIHMEDS